MRLVLDYYNTKSAGICTKFNMLFLIRTEIDKIKGTELTITHSQSMIP